MNLVGKIFVVLILIMSVVFMAMSMAVYATHRNWKEATEKVKTQRDAAQANNVQLKTELERLDKKLASEKTDLEQQIAKLETERQELIRELDEMQTRLAQLVGQNRALTGTVGATQQRLSTLIAEVGQLRKKILDAQQQRDQAFDNVVQKTDKLHQTFGNLVKAKEREKQLIGQVARYTQLLDDNNIDPNAQPKGLPPKVDGRVTAVSKGNLIEISVGSDDGLRAGHTLEVFRGRSYLGRARILRTSPDRAVAKLLKTYRKGIVQKGDRVATRLKIG
ncbi:MAG: hypothetical protein ACC645_07340 [Pirellulales bacterium]